MRHRLAPCLFAALVAAPLVAQEVVVDNSSPGFQQTAGFWFASANAGFYGTNSLLANVGAIEDRVRWTASLPVKGEYQVFAWWVASGNRSTAAPYRILAPGNIATVSVNQTVGGSQWQSLGNFVFHAGDAAVELSDRTATGTYVSADAVRWVFVRDADPPEPCTGEETELDPLGGSGNCAGLDLPGGPEPHPGANYSIHSDLPELFSSYGVLYSTRPVLPPDPGGTVPLNLRTQTNSGFSTIDDGFDVFLFHITPGAGMPNATRIVVHAKNSGAAPVAIRPGQVILTQGVIGNVHEFESNLGRRWMEEDYDPQRLSEVVVPAGGGAAIAWSDIFGPPGRNCFGLVRAEVEPAGAGTDLEISVVAIPGVATSQIDAETANWLAIAATSADSVPITTPPGAGELRRAVGVFPNFQWRADTPIIDIDALEPAGKSFAMALSQIQAAACPEGRQTVPMVLHPGFAHGDTIGNYQVDYRVQLRLANASRTENRAFDVRFGKDDSDVGLAWRVATSSVPIGDAALDAQPVLTEWAGPSQADGLVRDTLLEPFGGRITLRPCEELYLALRFAVLGNSSLPFVLEVVPAVPEDLPPLSDLWGVR